jgi:hypothetical protein
MNNNDLPHAAEAALPPAPGSAWFDILDAAEGGLSNVLAPLAGMELPLYPAGGTCGIANLSAALKSIAEAKQALDALREQLAYWTAMNEAYGPGPNAKLRDAAD